MEKNYANAASGFSMDTAKKPSVQPYEQKKLADTSTATKPLTLPTQIDRVSKVRPETYSQDLKYPSILPGGCVENTGGSLSDTAKDRLKQLGLISGFLFVIMAALKVIGRKEHDEE